MRLLEKCPLCGKTLELKGEVRIGEEILLTYKCGHAFARTALAQVDADALDLNAVDGSGKKARDYQSAGVEFIVNSGFNCIIGDQMRLGKTPQALLALKNKYKEYTPCLLLVRGANLHQWIREHKVWCDTLPLGIYPIVGGKAFIPPGFSCYIISMDTFSLAGTCKKCKHGAGKHVEGIGKCQQKNCQCREFIPAGDAMVDRLLPLGIKCVIVDEAHSFKNTDSNRSQALVRFLDTLNHGERDTRVHFTCNRCKHEWDKEGRVKFDKRIGYKVLSKSDYCPQCGAYCYVQQASDDEWVADPNIADKIKALPACREIPVQPMRSVR